MENVGQNICGAGLLFLRMVPAVNLAVTVYSKHSYNTVKIYFFKWQYCIVLYWVLVLPTGPCYSLVEEQQMLFPCEEQHLNNCRVEVRWLACFRMLLLA